MARTKKSTSSESLRIIGGKWRSRRIEFCSAEDLRPTGDRIRETLFNWLAPRIQGARCLDLYCGSGALGFEALSRGAEQAVLIDKNATVIAAVKKAAAQLDATDCDIHCQPAEDFLAGSCERGFDIVFLDPPFRHHQINRDLQLVSQGGWLASEGVVYFEQSGDNQSSPMADLQLDGWHCIREKQTGNIRFGLLERR